MKTGLFLISIAVLCFTFLFIWIVLIGPVNGQEKTYLKDSTTFAIIAMAVLLIAFVVVTVMVLM
ncbi:TPA: hypothetical protein QCJ76_001765 [Enterobacter asburiae]|nr:hypothetical protein [Enterobacter asburiae]